MTNELIKYDTEQVSLIKQTVAKNATDAELKMFIEFCKSTGLNPFKKELWFIKTDKGVQMMTGINGFLSIANSNPNFDGMEVSIEEKDGKPFSATAKVYRKDRKFPSVATVFMSEYFKPSKYGNGMWERMPRMMIQKVAKSVALREAFPQELNGIYTVEEMPAEYAVEMAEKPEIKTQIPAKHYRYALFEFEPEKKAKAVEWCNNHSIEIIYNIEDEPIAESDRELPFFKEVEIK